MVKLKKSKKKIVKSVKKVKVLALKKTPIKKPVKVRKVLIAKKNKNIKTIKKLVRVEKKPYVRLKKADVAKKVKKVVRKKVKNISTNKKAGDFSAESLFKAKIKVIGVGGGGGSIVSEIGKSLEKATFVIADTDIRALKKRSGMKYFWFGDDLTHGLGTGVNVELAKQAAESAKEKISGFFKDQDIIIFVASLGGGLGSGATQVFAEAARDFGGITFGIFTMPFKFEGKNKQRIAQNALKSLRKSLNVSLVIPNEKIFKIIDESTPIINAFSTVNKSLIGSLESLIDLIYNPGVINIDFADLRTILRGRGNSAFLNTIEESGKDAVEKVCENIFKNPLLQAGSFKTEKILFNIAGGDNLSMFQVEKISSHISDLNPKAKIIFGISKNSKLKNKIKTTILMTGASSESQIEEKVTTKELDPIITETPVLKVAPEKIKSPIKNNLKKEILVPVKIEKSLIVDKIKKQTIVKDRKVGSVVKKIKKIIAPKPVVKIPEPIEKSLDIPELEQKKVEIIETMASSAKKTIRRSGLEIKEAEDLQEKKRAAQEKEWEIPAFLRKVKFKG
jgi:cell division protein FtsZ